MPSGKEHLAVRIPFLSVGQPVPPQFGESRLSSDESNRMVMLPAMTSAGESFRFTILDNVPFFGEVPEHFTLFTTTLKNASAAESGLSPFLSLSTATTVPEIVIL